MNSTLSKIAASGVLMLSSMSANSALIANFSERDWLTSGDGALTYDNSTNLEWLDISETIGNSILDTEAESFFSGFRWATTSEINDLLDSVIDGVGERSSHDATAKSNFDTFNNLLGGTTGEPGSGYWRVQGNSRYAEKTSGQYGLAYAIQFNASQAVYVDDSLTNCCFSESFTHAYVGSWLVRDVAPVPLPAAFWLFGSALCGLTVVKRRRS